MHDFLSYPVHSETNGQTNMGKKVTSLVDVLWEVSPLVYNIYNMFVCVLAEEEDSPPELDPDLEPDRSEELSSRKTWVDKGKSNHSFQLTAH